MNTENKPIGFEIKSTGRAIGKLIDRVFLNDPKNELTGPEGFLFGHILFLKKKDPTKPVHAAAVMNDSKMSKAVTSTTLASLVNKGFIDLLDSTEDKRKKEIRVTDKGRESIKVYEADWKKINEILEDGLSEAEKETLKNLLSKIRKNAEEL